MIKPSPTSALLVLSVSLSPAQDLVFHTDSIQSRVSLNGGFDSLTFDLEIPDQPSLTIHSASGPRKLRLGSIDSISIRPAVIPRDTGAADLGLHWLHVGDSQTDGRAPDAMRSPGVVFRSIWEATFGSAPSHTVKGVGGIPLSATREMYVGMADRGKATWVHFQESGFQDEPGQRSPGEFADTFEAMVRSIRQDSPDALISTETAYSFQRESEPFRNWTEYNVALLARASILREEGIRIIVAETDRNMKALVAALGFSVPILPDGGHYSSAGNLMVALTYFDALGYDAAKLNLGGLEGVTEAQKQACLDIIAKH